MPRNEYPVKAQLSIPARANPRFADLSAKESEKGGRIIGGDQGDLRFSGYTLDGDRTIVDSPVLLTSHEGLSDDDVENIATAVLMESFQSIGAETLEHS